MATGEGALPLYFVFGGTTIDREASWRRIHAYSLATDTWVTTGSGLDVTYTNGAGKIGNKLYISGGFDPEPGAGLDASLMRSALYAYDPSTGSLTRRADMPRPTGEGVSGVIDNKLYVLAGTCLAEGERRYCRRLYRYNPATNTWNTRPLAPHFHSRGAGAVIGGKLYVAGGTGPGPGGTPTASLDVYDPAANTWKTLAPMPEAREQVAGAALGGRLYVIGGLGTSGSRAVFAYDPVTNTWLKRASLTSERIDPAAARVSLDGRSYVLAVGGNDGAQTSAELYAP